MRPLAPTLLPLAATALAVTTVSTVAGPTRLADQPRSRPPTVVQAQPSPVPRSPVPPDGSSRSRVVPPPSGTDAPSPVPRGRWSWPLEPRPALARPFVRPTSSWGAGHRGVDLTTGTGGEVLAVDDGIVAHVGVIAGRGTVTVLHRSGLRSTYEPMDASVSVGDAVRRGGRLGTVTAGGHCAPAACLHLGALRGDAYLDPLTLLTGSRVRLLPLR